MVTGYNLSKALRDLCLTFSIDRLLNQFLHYLLLNQNPLELAQAEGYDNASPW